MIYLRLITKRDNNGNPRWLFLVIDSNGDTVDAIEGYASNIKMWNKYPNAKGGPEIQVSISEYLNWLHWGEKNRSKS